VERLNNGAQDIVDHASGASPRHYDDHIDALVKSGSPWGLASGTVETQVQQLLDYENEFRATTGAGLVGAAAFNTPGNEYSFEGLTVQDQIEEAGSFLDENANYLMRAFDSFVVSGMSVSVAAYYLGNLTINVASGYVSGQGRLLHYDAQTKDLGPLGAGYYYVYARRNVNVIEIDYVIEADLNTVLDPENPIVLLSKILLTAPSSADTYDIRKFGVSSSSKNGFSVGSKPTSGKDGYGCDFISLNAAVEYIKALRLSEKNIGPSRIILVSDLVISSIADANIELLEGIEIDGCGNKISLSVDAGDAGLFVINNSNIILKNISVETNVSSFSPFSNLIFVAQTGNIKNLYINNIILTNSSSSMHYFMRFGSYTLSDSIICNCSVEVERGGFYTVNDTSTGNPITGCSIFNNRIYQTPFSAPSYNGYDGYNGIVIGSNNKVYGNVIDGGFTYGIVIRQTNYGNSISDNTIIGYRSNVVRMGTGIYTNNSNNISVTNNIIKGINTYGINCSSVDTLLGIIVTGNLITNRDVSSTLPAATIGIFGSVNGEVSASNNMITYMKGSSIKNVKEIKNNYIVDHILGNTVNSIYVDSCNFAVVESNYIKNSPGQSIYLVYCDNAVVNNNKIISPVYASEAKNAICIAGCNYVNLSNNSILGSVGGGTSSFGVGIFASSYCNITNTFVYKLDSAAFRIEVGSEQLMDDMGTSDLFVPCLTDGFPDHGILLIGTELIRYTSLQLSPKGFIVPPTDGRGYMGTGTEVHDAGDEVRLYHVYYGSDFCNFDGNYVVGTTHGFKFDSDCTNSVIKNNILIGDATYTALEAIYYPGAASLISNNYIYGFGNSGTCVVKLHTSDNCIIHGNYILNCSGNGVECNGSSGLSICDNQFKMLTSSASSGIIDVGGSSLISNNIIFSYTGAYGVSIEAGADNVKIIGNSFSGIGAGMTNVFYANTGCGYLEISDNYVSNAPGTVIALNGAHECTIDNNIFIGETTSVSAISNLGSRCVVNGNIFKTIGFDATCFVVSFTASQAVSIISNNLFHDYRGTAINCSSGTGFIINDNIFYPNSTYSASGITSVYNESNIKNNYFYYLGTAASSYGIQSSSGASRLQISGNVFSGNQSDLAAGISMVGSGSGHFICDNNLVIVPKIGIDLGSNTTSCISGNFISGSNTGVASNHLLTGTGAQCYISDNRLFSANYYSVLIGGSQWVCSNNYIICGSASNNAIALSNGVTQILISGNYISSYADAIQSGSVSNIDVVISNNYIIILGANNGIHNYLTTSAPYWYITDNKIVGTSGSSITAIKGIGSNSFVSNNYIDRFGASSGYGIITSSAASDSGINIINNFLYRPNSAMDSAIKIGNASYGNHINNNIIGTSSGGVSKYGIHLNAAIKSTCCNNIIYGSDVSGAYHAIYSSGVGSVTAEINSINNNFIVKPNGYGIYAGTFHKVSGNYIFINTPTGKYGIYATSYSGVSNNDIVGGEYGIYSNSVWNNIKSNSIANSTIVGIFANTSASEQNIIGNYIIQTAAAIGIKLNSANHNSKISSNYIYNAASSIACLSSNYCSITDNYISLCTTGITYDTGDYFDIANNYISGFTSIGISLLTSANGGKISSNYLYRSGAVGTTYGIKVDTSGNNKISSNYIYNTASSIACLSSNNCSINDNYILTCTTGITYNAGDYFDIANNYISGFTNTGISLLGGATNGKISSNYLYSGSVCGISIDTCNNNKISSNYICNTPYSISCISSDYCSITDNYILTCDTGITYNTGDYYDIANNYISGFTYCGIYILTSATNGKTSSNYLYSTTIATTYGIRINACNNNKISSNYIYNTASSIFCYNSNSCSIVDNYILTCTTGITYNTGDYFDIANNYISGFTDSGIHLLTSATNGKISSNYLYLFVPVGITHGIKIYASSNNNKISSNYIFSTTNSILCDNSNSCSITDNYIYTCTTGITYTYGDYFDIANNYIGGFTFRGIYLGFSANSSKISSNYLYLTGTQVGEMYGIIVHTCNSSFISSNYIYNYLTSGSYSTYVIYVTASSYIGINDNYILCNNQALTTSIYINESGWVNILGNQMISIGIQGIYIFTSPSPALPQTSFSICNNYIASGGTAEALGIYISPNINSITISNNHLYMRSTAASIGISCGLSGDTTGMRISCSSNMVIVRSGAGYYTFYYSGTGIRLIGNVAIGGVDPGSWSTVYNATITSGVTINSIMNVYTA
jgi:parallel beta-helix repeat protein